MTSEQNSRARELLLALPSFDPDVVRTWWRQLSVTQRAAIAADYTFWARPKQLPPPGPWQTWGFRTGRDFGKNWAISNALIVEARRRPGLRLLVIAQVETESVRSQILGKSGLYAMSPPWFRPTWEESKLRLTWPNGSRAWVYSPEAPENMRSQEFHAAWASEIQSWGRTTREKAWNDGVMSTTRLPSGDGTPARIYWDGTVQPRDPIWKQLKAMNAMDPALHVVVTGGSLENRANQSPGWLEKLRAAWSQAQYAREVLGQDIDEAEGAMWREAWVEGCRRHLPDRLERRVIGYDPAKNEGPGTDNTGIVECGLGSDGQGYVLADHSGKYRAEEADKRVLDAYVAGHCDLIVAETNGIGERVAYGLRAAAEKRGLEVIVVGKEERGRARPGQVFVKEVYARGSKEARFGPVATAYECGRVSHVVGANLDQLEDNMCTWIPPSEGSKRVSPGDLDALTHALVELLGLADNRPDARRAFAGLAEVTKALQQPEPPRSTLVRSIAAALRVGRSETIW